MSRLPWTDREVRDALGLDAGEDVEAAVEYQGVSTDSRTVSEGDLFVALVGDRHDGHDFVPEALSRGAAAAVVSRPVVGEGTARLYPVDDTLEALGRLARHRRRALGARVVGITGSTGKTTTKDLTRGALSPRYRVHATPGNRNNRVGLPLTVLDAPEDAEVLVLEMGTSEPGEIGLLAEIAEPGIGVLITVGETHLDGLGTLDGVLEEKLDLLRALPPDGTGVVGDQPPFLAEAARRACGSVRVAGWSGRADPDLRPSEPEADEGGCFRFGWRGVGVGLRIPGRHVILDALLALAVADLLEVDPEAAARGVGRVEAGSMRGEVRTVGSLTVLLDCYNANPQSVRAALKLLADHPAPGPRVAVLGSMLELGDRSAPLHREVLEEALELPLDLVVAVGEFAGAASSLEDGPVREPLVPVADVGEAYRELRRRLEGGEVVLLKGSRGVRLESVLTWLEEDFAGGGED